MYRYHPACTQWRTGIHQGPSHCTRTRFPFFSFLVALVLLSFSPTSLAEESSPADSPPPNTEAPSPTVQPSPEETTIQAQAQPALPSLWATANRDTFVYEQADPQSPKTRLPKHTAVFIEETDRWGWSRIWTADQTKGFTPRFHITDGQGPAPEKLILAWAPPAEDGDTEGDEEENEAEQEKEEPPPEILPLSEQQLRERWDLLSRERKALASFAKGELSDSFQTADLFTLDLLDAEAVSNRCTQLRLKADEKRRLVAYLEKLKHRALTTPAEDPAGSSPNSDEKTTTPSETNLTPQAQVPDGQSPSETTASSDATSPNENATPITETQTPEPIEEPPSQTAPSQPMPKHETSLEASKPTKPAPSRLELEQAELDALTLRLAFLEKPLEQRKALLDAEVERKRAAELKAKAEAEQRQAEADARAAEEARRQALERAEQARSEAERALALELARVEGVKNELAEFRKRLSITQQESFKQREQRAKQLSDLLAQAGNVAESSKEASELYEKIVQELTKVRDGISSQLDAFHHTAKAPRFVGELKKLRALNEDQEAEKRKLEESVESLARDADEQDSEAQELALAELRATVDWETSLNDLRLTLLHRLSEQDRSELLGFGPRGIAQFSRELLHFSLMLRWMEFGGERLVIEKLTQLRDPYQALEVLTRLSVLFLVIFGYLFVRQRLDRFVQEDASPQKRTTQLNPSLGFSQRLKTILRPVYRDVLFLILTLLWPLFLDVHSGRSTGTLLYRLLLLFAFYRLSLSVGFRTLLWIILMNIGQLDEARRDKLERSVLIVSRFIFSIFALLTIAEFMLGEGYLYHLVARVARWGSLVIFVSLAFWWRKKVSSDFTTLWPESSLSRELLAARGRWYELIFTLLALVYLVIYGFFGAIRHMALGFDLTQKLVAYLFRKRLEQEAETRQDQRAMYQTLPKELKQAFSEAPETSLIQRIEHFPKMDALLHQMERWEHGGQHGSFLVVGKAGVGKTEWLREALRRSQTFTSTYLDLHERLIEPERLVSVLSEGIFPDQPASTTVEELVKRLRQGERRTVALDNLHMAHLRGTDTLRGWWAFNRLMEQCGDHIFWLVSFGYHPYEFLSWVRKDRDVFRDAVMLKSWNETLISQMLAKRLASVGWSADYRALTPGGESGVYTQARLELTARDFNRLIWDFSLGSPRSALHYWRNSLVQREDQTVAVRLFTQPDASLLERRDEIDKFVLASVYWHETLTVEEAASTLHYPLYACADSMIKMNELGILSRQGKWYSVTTPWWPLVTRYLRRKNLIRN